MARAAALLPMCVVLAAGDTLGSFNISIDGIPTRLYAVSQAWQGRFFTASADGSQLRLNGGGRFYAARARMPTPGALVADSYWQAPLLGRELSYTVDLSGVGCSCNAAMYFVSMPGHNKTAPTTPDATAGGDYYCGANAGKTPGNNYCPEMDALEANKYAMQVTPHTCSGSNRGSAYYEMCDWRGCYANSYLASATAMCPSANCTIDTSRPFRHAVAFETGVGANGSTLAAIRSTLRQDDREFAFPVCRNSTYLEAMTPNLRGMVPTFSLWGVSQQGMSWLDGMTGCTGDCNVSASSVTWRDIELNQL